MANLTDTGPGFGGYFAGYFGLVDAPTHRAGDRNEGKSTENNADIFAALTALAAVENQLGNTAAAAQWTTAANVAGDFVMQMFDAGQGRFNLGTVPTHANPSPTPGPTFCPGPTKGNDILNTCDVLDANTFTTLALAGASRYRNQIDWRQPITYVLNRFQTSVMAAGQPFNGFDLVLPQTPGSNGVAWEFTAQAVVAMRYVDQLYAQTTFEAAAAMYVAEMRHAQTSAPFGDGLGLVASTLAAGETLPPLDQCLVTPFQCIAERVGLAASIWAIFADQNINPFPASQNPVPALSALAPTSATAGGPAVTLTVTGSNFVPSSVVQWNGSSRTTMVVSGTQLTAAIPATDIAQAGTASVTVVNPAPGGGTSNALSFPVNHPGSSGGGCTLSPGTTVDGLDLTLVCLLGLMVVWLSLEHFRRRRKHKEGAVI